jgi:hypothetical protein
VGAASLLVGPKRTIAVAEVVALIQAQADLARTCRLEAEAARDAVQPDPTGSTGEKAQRASDYVDAYMQIYGWQCHEAGLRALLIQLGQAQADDGRMELVLKDLIGVIASRHQEHEQPPVRCSVCTSIARAQALLKELGRG